METIYVIDSDDEVLEVQSQTPASIEETFECPVCFDQCKQDVKVTLPDCCHSFCNECMKNVVTHCGDAKVRCPYTDGNFSCKAPIPKETIKVLVDKATFELYLKKLTKPAENNAFHCKTPDCTGWCIFSHPAERLPCPVCKKINCAACQAIHEGMDCQQYRDDVLNKNQQLLQSEKFLNEMTKKGKMMPCPNCKVMVEKMAGCDWLQCRMCKTEICWATRGPRWGPRGHGDISGGCRCNVGGVKCRPNCGNCH